VPLGVGAGDARHGTPALRRTDIYTGHNPYLKGNQLTSESSTRPSSKSLLRGVRVIELDLWPNRENAEILVMHGGELKTPRTHLR